MASASTRLRRLVLAFWFAAGLCSVSPLARLVPVTTIAAAEDNGLGAGGAAAAYNFVLAASIILAFIFGFAVRDVVHRHAMRAESKKDSKPAPKRA